MQLEDTIAAISTAVGPSARMIVRLSGPQAPRIASQVCPGLLPRPATAQLVSIQVFDLPLRAWCYFFAAPHSYSGEDTTEFHVPGNALVAGELLASLVRAGARHAEAGEFTARAYFNGRMDLTRAEGVAATIAASSERELRAARQLLAGELSRRLQPVIDAVADGLALVEIGIDFSEEDISIVSKDELRERMSGCVEQLQRLVHESARFERIAHEPRIVLVGRPNAGKSTLLNVLAGHERAVTSPQSGTTRDAVSAEVRLARGIVAIIDIAGLETERAGSFSAAEHEIALKMQAAAQRTLASADVVVLVHDCTDSRPPPVLPVPANLTVFTKLDLGRNFAPAAEAIAVSARSGENLPELCQKLDLLAFGEFAGGAALTLNNRHREAIATAVEALLRAANDVESRGAELIALDLREALEALGLIVGSVTPDDVLGRIFAGFCIGK